MDGTDSPLYKIESGKWFSDDAGSWKHLSVHRVSQGVMVVNTKIDGYEIGSDGVRREKQQ